MNAEAILLRQLGGDLLGERGAEAALAVDHRQLGGLGDLLVVRVAHADQNRTQPAIFARHGYLSLMVPWSSSPDKPSVPNPLRTGPVLRCLCI